MGRCTDVVYMATGWHRGNVSTRLLNTRKSMLQYWFSFSSSKRLHTQKDSTQDDVPEVMTDHTLFIKINP